MCFIDTNNKSQLNLWCVVSMKLTLFINTWVLTQQIIYFILFVICCVSATYLSYYNNKWISLTQRITNLSCHNLTCDVLYQWNLFFVSYINEVHWHNKSQNEFWTCCVSMKLVLVQLHGLMEERCNKLNIWLRFQEQVATVSKAFETVSYKMHHTLYGCKKCFRI